MLSVSSDFADNFDIILNRKKTDCIKFVEPRVKVFIPCMSITINNSVIKNK